MNSNEKLKIFFAGEKLERFSPQTKILNDQYQIFIEDGNRCLGSALPIRDLFLIIFQKKTFKDFCVNCIRRVKGFLPQTVIVVLCESISKTTMCNLFRFGVRDVLECSFDKEINLNEAITKVNFIFSNRPKNRERRSNFLTLKHIKEFPSITEPLPDDKRIERAKAYIEKHYNCPLALEHVANIACMSKYHFCRTFKRFDGISFKGYVKNVRIEKAKELLNNTGLSISEIAFEVGFQSLSYFNTLFKSHLNISPRNFRKMSLK